MGWEGWKNEVGGRGFQVKDTEEAKLRGPSWQRSCLARVVGGGESGSLLEEGPLKMTPRGDASFSLFFPHSQGLHGVFTEVHQDIGKLNNGAKGGNERKKTLY